MVWRAGAARVLGFLLLLLPLAACGGSEPPASKAPDRTPKVAESAEALGEIEQEINDQIVDALERAFLKADQKLLPPIKPGIKSDTSEQLNHSINRSREFRLDRVTFELHESVSSGRRDRFHDLSGSYRLKGIPADLPISAEIRVEPDGNGKWQLRWFNWVRHPVWILHEPVQRTQMPAALIFHPPGFDPRELSGLIAEARTNLGKSLPGVGSKTYLVLMPADHSDFLRVGSGSASVSVTQTTRGREFETSEPWLIVDPRDWEDADPQSRRTLILHEVTHAILAPRTSPMVPDWVSEGIAVYYSGDPGLEPIRREPEELDENSLMEVAHAWPSLSLPDYALSGAAISVLADRFGEKKVLTFLEAFDEEMTDEELERIARSRIPSTADDITKDLTPRLIQKSFDMSIEQLDAEAKAWIRARI
jgi:hypothetical protein